MIARYGVHVGGTHQQKNLIVFQWIWHIAAVLLSLNSQEINSNPASSGNQV
jgi:hypothetical protein